jgi:tRNA pseudouridine-54 N-methylase
MEHNNDLFNQYVLYLVDHPEFERYTGEDIRNIAFELEQAYKKGLEESNKKTTPGKLVATIKLDNTDLVEKVARALKEEGRIRGVRFD